MTVWPNAVLRFVCGNGGWVKADAADLVALALRADVKPVLLLHGVALAFVVAARVSLLCLLHRGTMERFAHDDSARCVCGGGEGLNLLHLVFDHLDVFRDFLPYW
jgi:hypothetical protein